MYGGDAGSCALHCPTSPGTAQWTRPPPTLPTCVSAVRLPSDDSTFLLPGFAGVGGSGSASRYFSSVVFWRPLLCLIRILTAVSLNWRLASGTKAF